MKQYQVCNFTNQQFHHLINIYNWTCFRFLTAQQVSITVKAHNFPANTKKKNKILPAFNRTVSYKSILFLKTTFLFKWPMTYRKLYMKFLLKTISQENSGISEHSFFSHWSTLPTNLFFTCEITDSWRDRQIDPTQCFMLEFTEQEITLLSISTWNIDKFKWS